jgi:hypothetical protein
MKAIITFIKSLSQPQEIKEAPRFQDWYEQINPKDKPLENFQEFQKVLYEYKFGKKMKKTMN